MVVIRFLFKLFESASAIAGEPLQAEVSVVHTPLPAADDFASLISPTVRCQHQPSWTGGIGQVGDWPGHDPDRPPQCRLDFG
jgi:hypothetical protein